MNRRTDNSEPDDAKPLEVELALSALDWVDGYVHTFIQAPAPTLVLIGADWSLEDVRAAFAQQAPEVAGEAARAMHHGIACRVPKVGPVFFRTLADWQAPP